MQINTPYETILKSLISLGLPIANYTIPYADLRTMLSLGIVPLLENEEIVESLEYYRQGLSQEDMYFWTEIEDVYQYLCRVRKWVLLSPQRVLLDASQGNSKYIRYTHPELLYSTLRPITNMSMFRTPLSNTYSNSNIIPNYKIRVSRYSSSLTKGFFNSERPPEMCGRFYYSEPESTTFLTYSNPLVSFNKVTAAWLLLEKVTNKSIISDLKWGLSKTDSKSTASMIGAHIREELPRDLMFTPKMALDLGIRDGDEISSTKKVYLGDVVGAEEYLDQPICIAASSLGYDVVIFERLAGPDQVDTELMDTREDTFSHLWYLL